MAGFILPAADRGTLLASAVRKLGWAPKAGIRPQRQLAEASADLTLMPPRDGVRPLWDERLDAVAQGKAQP